MSATMVFGSMAFAGPAAATPPPCPSYTVCLYQNANFSGHYLFISNGSATPDYTWMTWDDAPSISVNDQVSSVINHGSGTFYAYRDVNYLGPWADVSSPGARVAQVAHNDAYSSSVSYCTC